MSVAYIPVFKMAVSYTVNVGRRWSIVEHLLLTEVAKTRRGIVELAEEANLPRRLVVEAMINLLRAGWVEVRATSDGARFGATRAGAKRAGESELPAQFHRDVRWISLCFERITGTWFRSEDLELVYANDLPDNPQTLDERYDTVDVRDLPRDLLYLRHDEALEPVEPILRTPSRPYARVNFGADGIEGLPNYAPLDLIQAISESANVGGAIPTDADAVRADFLTGGFEDDLTGDDLIVGGEAHFQALKAALANAKSTVLIHSCFVHPDVVKSLLPDFQAAATRGVRVELLWGLYNDPESKERRVIADAEKVLETLPAAARSKVKMSTISSRSHAKILLYDCGEAGHWEMVLGSCNFLSSWFNLVEVSLKFRNVALISSILGRLIATQQPASGAWPPMTTRLNRLWGRVRSHRAVQLGNRAHETLRLLADREHYACVTQMRDEVIRRGPGRKIYIGCDLYGSTAESSVLTPMQRAAECGNSVRIFYRRPSKYLRDEGLQPDSKEAQARGIDLSVSENLHGKFIAVECDTLVISSFNWLSTAVEGTRTKSAELGMLVQGSGIGSLLVEKLALAGVSAPTVSNADVTPDLFQALTEAGKP